MPELWRRKFLLASVSAAAYGASSGSVAADTPSKRALSAGLNGESLSKYRVTMAAAPTLPAVPTPPSATATGNPWVPADPGRNYRFSPKQPASLSGVANVGVGENVLGVCTTGSWNTALGDMVMWQHLDGINNVGVGSLALYSSVSLIDCTAVGVEALANAVDGIGGTAVGRLACFTMASAGNNTGIGDSALRFLQSGEGNSALGYTSAENVLRGSCNTLLGVAAGKNLPEGDYNTGVGGLTMTNFRGGNDNVAVGAMALSEAQGSSNVAIGMRAGYMTSSVNRSVFVGGMSGAVPAQAPDIDNVVVIGHGAAATQSHQLVLGNSETQEFVLGDVTISKSELLALLAMVRQRA